MSFGATNKPCTCLWCGRKLRRQYHTEWEQTERKPAQCGTRLSVDGEIYEKRTCKSTKFKKSDLGWSCIECHTLTGGSRKVASRRPFYDKPGGFGDGHFCGKNCGYHFGVAMANNGRRLQPVNENEKTKKKISSTA